MSGRAIHASTLAALESDNLVLVNLVTMSFDTPVLITDAGHDVTYGGDTWLQSGHLLNIDDVSETTSLEVGTLNFIFSAVEQTYVSLFLNNDYIDVQVEYWKALLDSNRAVIGEPILQFDGNITGYEISESSTSSEISVECANQFANFEAVAGRYTNSASQQAHYPTDTFFDFFASAQKDFKWGRG